jgi:hypothetical protein
LRRDIDHDLDEVVPSLQKLSSYPDSSHYWELSSRNGAPNNVDPAFQLRTVLVIDIRKMRHWQAGIPGQEEDIEGLTDATFKGSLSEYANARSKVYWISVIGSHWRYGVSDGQDSSPLIDWHTRVDDEDSYKDLQELADLVERL